MFPREGFEEDLKIGRLTGPLGEKLLAHFLASLLWVVVHVLLPHEENVVLLVIQDWRWQVR